MTWLGSLLSWPARALDAAKDALQADPVSAPRPLLTLDLYREEAEDGPRRPLPDFADFFRARHAAAPCQYVGVCVKATSGTAYDMTWFREAWPKLARVAGDLYGVEWFRQAYHIARPTLNHRRQAEFFCSEIERAGGMDRGTMWPALDVEPPSSKALKGASRQQIADCAAVFAEVVAAELGRRIGVYGGRLASVEFKLPRLGLPVGTRVWTAAYVASLPVNAIERAGWRLEDVDQFQYTDGKVSKLVTRTGIVLPRYVPGVRGGDLDCSVFIGGGAAKPTLAAFKRRMVLDSVISTAPAEAA